LQDCLLVRKATAGVANEGWYSSSICSVAPFSSLFLKKVFSDQGLVVKEAYCYCWAGIHKMKIHVIGDAFCDIVAQGIHTLPAWGGAASALSIKHYAGGSALNTAVHIKSLLGKGGADEVVFFTAMGEKSDFARLILENHLKEWNVILRAKYIADYPTGTCIVLSGEGERAFVTSPGAVTMFSPKHLDLDEIARCDHLHLGGLYCLDKIVPALPGIIRVLRSKNPKLSISLDTNTDSTGLWGSPWLLETLTLVDIVKMNEEEAKSVIDKNEPNESNKGTQPVVWLASKVRCASIITKGKDGAIFALAKNPSIVLSVPSPEVKVVDTCGAGDAFTAGLLTTWVQRPAEFRNAVLTGCACGAFTITNIGGCDVPVERRHIEKLLQASQ